MGISQPWVLSLDRTDFSVGVAARRVHRSVWSFGQIRFNIFMLGIVHQGIAYPIVWTLLEKKGNSNSLEHMELMDKFREIFPSAQIACVCGDREFIGKEWLTYLMIEPIIPFRLRIKASHKIHDGQKNLNASIVFAHLQPGQVEVLSGPKVGFGVVRFMFLLCVSEDGELLIVISADSPENAFKQAFGFNGFSFILGS